MSLLINGTTIPENGGVVKFNGVNIEKVIFKGVEVWKKVTSVAVNKSLSFIIGNDTAQSKYIVANCWWNKKNYGATYDKSKTVLFTAPRDCTLSGTLTLTASGNATVDYLNVVVHKNMTLGTQNGQTWADVVTANPWNSGYGMGVYKRSVSKTFSVAMKANYMLLIWALDQVNDSTGTITLSLSGSYQ